MARMKRWIAVALLAVASCKDAPSEDQCRQLLEHLVDLEFKKAGAQSTDAMKAEIAKQKKAVAEAKPEFITVCRDKTAKGRVVCALAATDLDGVAKCDEAK